VVAKQHPQQQRSVYTCLVMLAAVCVQVDVDAAMKIVIGAINGV